MLCLKCHKKSEYSSLLFEFPSFTTLCSSSGIELNFISLQDFFGLIS